MLCYVKLYYALYSNAQKAFKNTDKNQKHSFPLSFSTNLVLNQWKYKQRQRIQFENSAYKKNP